MTVNVKTVLVTGGCGFIGCHIVAGLVQEGYKIRVLDNLSTGKLENLDSIDKKDVEVCIGDVTDLSTLKAAIDGCEYVFHQAAVVSVPKSVEAPIETGKVNYGGTLRSLTKIICVTFLFQYLMKSLG